MTSGHEKVMMGLYENKFSSATRKKLSKPFAYSILQTRRNYQKHAAFGYD